MISFFTSRSDRTISLNNLYKANLDCKNMTINVTDKRINSSNTISYFFQFFLKKKSGKKNAVNSNKHNKAKKTTET